MGQVQAEDDVARIEHGEINRRVGLRPGVRLHVDVLGAEKLFRAVAGEVFSDIDELAAAVVALAGVALGILIGQHAAHALHDGGAGVVLAGDHFQAVALALDLAGDGRPDFRVVLFDRIHSLCKLSKSMDSILSVVGRDSSIGMGKTIASHYSIPPFGESFGRHSVARSCHRSGFRCRMRATERLTPPVRVSAMSTVKETMAEIISRQPEDSTYDEILRELAYGRMVQRGLADSDEGRAISDEEIKRTIDDWQE